MREINLSRLKKVPLRDIWKHEALDFTNWLALSENLALLGEELDIDFVSAETERGVGSFSVDILAEDSNGKRIIIENQFGNTDHDHLGKLITYASGLQAENIIWVVEKVREEHEQAINWLNEHTNEDANFFLIEIKAMQIGDSLPAPQFNIVCKPNGWAKIVRQAGTTAHITDLKLSQQAFWSYLKEYGEQHPSRAINSWQKALPQHWYNISIGSSKANVVATVNSKKQYVGIELNIYSEKSIFHKIYEDKAKLEEHLGKAVQWMELPDKKTSRILITHEGNFLDENTRDELVAWLYDNTQTFAKTFLPYLK